VCLHKAIIIKEGVLMLLKLFRRTGSKIAAVAAFLVIASLFVGPLIPIVSAATYIFPVIGSSSFSNDFNAPRASGPHHAIDIIANKGQKIVAAVGGTITRVNYPEPSWGYAVYIESDAGYTYRYLHINNDNPGTNDNRGGGMNAYAVDMKPGNKVIRGQHLGWVGDSGNSNGVSHLHFEVTNPNGDPVNPYNSLRSAQRLPRPVATYPPVANEILPFGDTYKGGLNVAVGNFDIDPQQETVVGAGKGGGPRVKTYDNNDAPMGHNFYAFLSTLRGGVDVATGDVDGDGVDEVITGEGPGHTSNVAVYKLVPDGNTVKLLELSAFGSHPGGVRVAAGDVDGDSLDEIIVGAGPGGGPHVKVYELDGTNIQSFFPYAMDFRGGVDVASADVTGTTAAEIIVAPSSTGSSRVQVFDLNLTQLSNFYAYEQTFRGGVRLTAGNVRTNTSQSEILTAPESKHTPQLKLFTSQGTLLDDDMYIERWWIGYHDVGAGFGTTEAATGINRRGSVRPGI